MRKRILLVDDMATVTTLERAVLGSGFDYLEARNGQEAVAARLPRAPGHCLGVVDCRGRLVPVFALGARLGITPPRTERELVDGHVVLVQDPVGEIGYAVDELSELSEAWAEPLEGGGSA